MEGCIWSMKWNFGTNLKDGGNPRKTLFEGPQTRYGRAGEVIRLSMPGATHGRPVAWRETSSCSCNSFSRSSVRIRAVALIYLWFHENIVRNTYYCIYVTRSSLKTTLLASKRRVLHRRDRHRRCSSWTPGKTFNFAPTCMGSSPGQRISPFLRKKSTEIVTTVSTRVTCFVITTITRLRWDRGDNHYVNWVACIELW
jgi:hypothetical protein